MMLGAWVASVLTLVVPGLPLALLLWRRVPAARSPFVVASTVPLVSIAVAFTAIFLAPIGQVSRGFAVALLLVSIVATAVIAWRVPKVAPEIRPALDRWMLLGVGAIVVAATVGAVAWISGIPDLDQPGPNYDAAAHGFMTARILESGSNSADQVVISGPPGVGDSGGYYPLGIHSSAAIATALSGSSVAAVLNIYVVLFAALLYPIACYALVQVIVRSLPFAAPLAALASTAFESFPYKPIGWGGLGLIIGNVTAFALAALVLTLFRRAPRSWPAAVFAALAAVGLFHIHNSEVVFAGALIALVLLFDLPASADGGAQRLNPRALVDAWASIWRIGLVSFVLLAPLIPSVIRGGSERSGFDDTPLGDPLFSLGQILFMQTGLKRQGLLLVFAVVGMCVLVRRRRYGLPIMSALVVIGAYWTATTDNPVSSALTLPWWRQPERMIYVVSMLGSIGFGIAIAAAVGPIERLKRPTALARWAAVGTIVGISGFIVLVPGAKAGRTMVYRSYEYYSPISDAARAGFDVAAELGGDDGVVLTDHNRDGSLWMYALAGGQPLVALGLVDGASDPTWAERDGLIDGIRSIGTNPAYDALIEKYNVRALYFDETTYTGSEHTITRDELRELPGLHEVFTEGTVSVFAVVRTANS